MKKLGIYTLHLKIGGAEKALISLVNSLCSKYKITVYVLYDNKNDLREEIDKRVTIKYYSNSCQEKEKFLKSIKDLDFVSFIKYSFINSYALFCRYFATFFSMLKNEDDIVITQNVFFNTYSSLMLKNKRKIAWEHNHHDNDKKHIKKVVRSVRNIDYLVNVSRGLKEDYEKYVGDKSVVIYNLVDVKNNVDHPLYGTNLIAVGRFSKEKRFHLLVDIMDRVSKEAPGVMLNLVGDGEEFTKIQSNIKDRGLEDCIKLHGFQNKEYIDNLLLDSKLYLMTSSKESFSITVLEALMYGVLPVAFDKALGPVEIITDTGVGYLVKEGDIDMYANEIIRLLNTDLTDERRKALKNVSIYDKDKQIDKWEELLNKE